MTVQSFWVCCFNTRLARYEFNPNTPGVPAVLKDTAITENQTGIHQPDFALLDPWNVNSLIFASEAPQGYSGLYQVGTAAGARPTEIYRDQRRLTSPRGVAHARGYLFVADNVLESDHPSSRKGILIFKGGKNKNLTFEDKVSPGADHSDFVPVVSHKKEIYFGTNTALYKIKKNGRQFSVNESFPLPVSFSRGLASGKGGLHVLCGGEQSSSRSVLYWFDDASKTFKLVKVLSRAYTGICVCKHGLLLTAFFDEKDGDLGAIYFLHDSTETRIAIGEVAKNTTNPLGIFVA